MNKCVYETLVASLALFLGGCASSGHAVNQTSNQIDTNRALAMSQSNPSDSGYIQLDARKEKLADIRTDVVKAVTSSEPLEFSSTVECPSDAASIVYSPVNGVVTRVLADVGDNVHVGQVVAYVNSPDLADLQSAALNAQARLAEAEAQVKLIQTRLELAGSNENRLILLENERIAARKDVEAAKSHVAMTDAELVAAKTSASAAKTQLQSARVRLRSLGLTDPSTSNTALTFELPIRSPSTGVVTQRNVNVGQSVGPTSTATGSKSSALMTVADLAKVWVMLEVPQAEASRVRLGSTVSFRSEVAPGERFVGTVTRLGENYDPQSRTVQVRTEIRNSRRLLKPGMLMLALAAGVSHGNALPAVPLSALQTIDGRDYVFVGLADHRFEKRVVTCADRNSQTAWLSKGVKAGESVVTSGSFYLKTEIVRATIGGGA